MAALWFSLPAAWNNVGLWWVWLVSLAFPVALLVVVLVIGVRRIHVNEVADPASVRWASLQIQER